MAQFEYRTHAALYFNGTGQEIEFYPPAAEVLRDGAANAATYSIYRGEQSNDDTPILTGTATLDSTSQTTQNIAGPTAADRAIVQVASGSGIVIGRRYLLTNNSGNGSQRMIVVVRRIAGAFLYHETDIMVEFTLPCTFVGLRQTFTIDSTFIQTASNINTGTAGVSLTAYTGTDAPNVAPPYRVRWSYTTGSTARVSWTTFDVSRAPLQHSATVESIRAMVPDIIWDEWTQQRGMDFAPQLNTSFERVRFDIRMAGYDPNMVTDPMIVDRLVTLAAVARIMRALDKDTDGAYEKDYRNSFEKAIGTGLRAWMQADSTGATSREPIKQLWLTR